VVPRIRALGVLLCYNDADILADAIEWLLINHHDLVVWDHGSTDATASVLDRYQSRIRERRFLEREFDFYQLYPAMSQNLIDNYIGEYDWISWPDQDELLEGPTRERSYYEYIGDVLASEYDWVQFRNFNFWFTSEDDPAIESPVERVRRYGLFDSCAPRVRAWRASSTNIRQFNHNPTNGKQYPVLFNLRHYPARSEEQMLRRLSIDRAGLQRGRLNTHYNTMNRQQDRIRIPPGALHRDDGCRELNPSPIFPWTTVYFAPEAGWRRAWTTVTSLFQRVRLRLSRLVRNRRGTP
jgi:hypothetical protein